MEDLMQARIRQDVVLGLRLLAPTRIGRSFHVYLWRPILPNPKDDMVLEVAIASGATHIVTFDRKDLRMASQFDITVLPPADFIRLLP